jgi:hypothetical protein
MNYEAYFRLQLDDLQWEGKASLHARYDRLVGMRSPRGNAAKQLARLSHLFLGDGSSSAISRRQSASESCGPETNVPLTFVLTSRIRRQAEATLLS